MDFWGFVDKNFAAILIPIGTLGGAFIGGYLTSKSQKYNISKQIEWDQDKERRSQIKETLEVYNEVLKIDGTIQVVDHNNGNYLEINIVEYSDYIRPLLYKKFHQLHQDVAHAIEGMDNDIERYNFNEEITDDEQEELASDYLELIQMLKSHLKSYRKNEMKF